MTNKTKSIDSNQTNHEINLREVISAIWDGKWWIISITAIFSIAIVVYALSLSNLYTSKSLLKSANIGQSPFGSSMSKYSGIASLAGISLPSMDTNSSQTALETLKSLKFFESSFLPHINLEDLMAVKSWNLRDNSIRYDDNVFNSLTNTWVRDVSPPRSKIPSVQEAHLSFNENNLRISEDKLTGFITIAIEHKSPFIAREWVELLIEQINDVLREESKQRIIMSISFLRQQISSTNYTEVKQALSSILQQETEKLMLVEVNKDYIFQVIDPPFIPETKSGPNRAFICILGALLGGMIGMLIALIKYFKRSLFWN